MSYSSEHIAALTVLAAGVVFGACYYEPPPEVVLDFPEEGTFLEGDPLVLSFSVPIDPATLTVSVWPDERDSENEIPEDSEPLLEGCTLATSPCGTTTFSVAEDGMSASVTLDPDDLGQPDVPFLLEVHPGLQGTEPDVGELNRSIFFDFQFKPVDPTAEPVDFQEGAYTIVAIIEEPLPLIMNLIAEFRRGPGNEVIGAAAEGVPIEGAEANTGIPEELYVDPTERGYMIFAGGTLRESASGERFFETTPFNFRIGWGGDRGRRRRHPIHRQGDYGSGDRKRRHRRHALLRRLQPLLERRRTLPVRGRDDRLRGQVVPVRAHARRDARYLRGEHLRRRHQPMRTASRLAAGRVLRRRGSRRGGGDRMKSTGECPKCGCTEILVVDEALIPNYEFSNSVEKLTLTAHYGEYGARGAFGSTKKSRVGVGMHAFVCGKCAYIEFYANDLDVLRQFATNRVGNVRKK